MIETIEERKYKLKLKLEERYREKEVRWPWQNKNDAVKSTKVISLESCLSFYDEESVLVQNEFSHHKIILAILFFAASFCFVYGFLHSKDVLYFIGLLFSAGLYFQYQVAKKKRIFIEITKEGIQLEKEPFIAWQNVIASYVCTQTVGDDERSYLLMYHYNTISDEFIETKYAFEITGMKYPDICFLIEHWKYKSII